MSTNVLFIAFLLKVRRRTKQYRKRLALKEASKSQLTKINLKTQVTRGTNPSTFFVKE